MNKAIDVWIDFNSPFSYLGIRNLQKALKLTNREKDFFINCRTFQIDPEFNPTKKEDVTDFHQYLDQQKKLLMLEQVKPMIDQARIVFNFDAIVPANTFNAHLLTHWEQKVNKNQDPETLDLIFHGFWTAGEDISDWEILKPLATSAGLEATSISELANDKQIFNEILKDEREAINQSVGAVPYFKFPNGDKFQGLISVEQATELIKKNK